MTESDLVAMASEVCGDDGRFSTPDGDGRYALFVTPETLRALAAMKAQLAYYRGTCDVCGREGVLLEKEMDGSYEDTYLVSRCGPDWEECSRVVEERGRPDRKKHRDAALRGWAKRRQREEGKKPAPTEAEASIEGEH